MDWMGCRDQSPSQLVCCSYSRLLCLNVVRSKRLEIETTILANSKGPYPDIECPLSRVHRSLPLPHEDRAHEIDDRSTKRKYPISPLNP